MRCVSVAGWSLPLPQWSYARAPKTRSAMARPSSANYNLNSLYQFDELGRYGRPNASYLKWHLNEVGYRSPALRTGTYRIACMGSSETFGRYESPDKEWPRQLESLLNRRAGDDHYEVVNIAYPGLSVATMVRRLPQILSTLHPKLVVFYPSYTPYIAIDHPYVPQPPAPVKQVSQTFELRLSGRIGVLARTSMSDSARGWLRLRFLIQNAVGDKAMDRLPEQNIQAFKSDLDTLTKQLLANRVQVVLVTHANRFGSNLGPSRRAPPRRLANVLPIARGAGLSRHGAPYE